MAKCPWTIAENSWIGARITRIQSENREFGAETDGTWRFPQFLQQLVEKVALMEKRLKEAGIFTEQLGQHELVREIHRIQVWIHSLNGGWSSNTPPDDWKNPIPILENRCKELQAQSEKVQAEIQRVQSTRTQTSPVQSNRTQSVPIQCNPCQWDPFPSNGNQFKSNPMDSNPVRSNSMDSNLLNSHFIQWTIRHSFEFTFVYTNQKWVVTESTDVTESGGIPCLPRM